MLLAPTHAPSTVIRRLRAPIVASALAGCLASGGLLSGCGAAPPPATSAPIAQRAEPPPPAIGESGVIRRAELESTLELGLGLFLQQVSTEPDLRDGRFVGFRVVELGDPALFEGVDLAPGDTIVEVNGQPIERPEHAYTVWTGLRVASELTVIILRGDERRELRFAIVD
jgi:S1-C subfamily serine protease